MDIVITSSAFTINVTIIITSIMVIIVKIELLRGINNKTREKKIQTNQKNEGNYATLIVQMTR